MDFESLVSCAEKSLGDAFVVKEMDPPEVCLSNPVLLMYLPKAYAKLNHNALKFWQSLYALSGSRTRRYHDSGIKESPYENLLRTYNVPFEVVGNQLHCPVRFNDLKLSDFSEDARSGKTGSKNCADSTIRMSEMRHKRKRGRRNVPKIVGDIVYSCSGENIYAEVKTSPVTASSKVELHARQLEAYGEYLDSVGEDTPIARVSQTFPSYSELESYENLSRRLKDDLYIIVISSDYCLKRDLSSRMKRSKNSLQAYSKYFKPEVRVSHVKEISYLTGLMELCREIDESVLYNEEKNPQALSLAPEIYPPHEKILTSFGRISSASSDEQATLPAFL
jgi:hypothetical protein